MCVPLFDVRFENELLLPRVRAALDRVLDSGLYIQGDEVRAFETEVARHLGTRHAVGVSSGSDALFMGLSALDVGSGDEVVTTPFSFFATAEAIARTGATPRFVDVDAATLSLDPDAVERALTSRTKAILVVHLFGRPAALEELSALAERKGLALVEDAAQAFGARCAGRAVGAFGAAGCFSFFPTKPLGGIGDGGLIVTDEDSLAERARGLRHHGSPQKDLYVEVGGNFRLDEMQAAILRVKLPHVTAARAARARHAAAYDAALSDLPGLRIPAPLPAGDESAWSHYTIQVDPHRDALGEHLARAGIETRVYYPRPLHLQPVFEALGIPRGSLPVSERAAETVLSLPLFSRLTEEQREYVVRSVCDFFERPRRP